jgi:hypothetical protein
MYIFLDIDGVLNRRPDWARPYTVNRENVKNLAGLVSSVRNPKIILTSSWRTGWEPDESRCTAQIQMLLSILRGYGLSVSGKTEKSPDGDRMEEICHFLNRHPQDAYIVLDDDRDEYLETPENLYLTDPENGLTDADVKKIKKALKRGELGV